MEDFKKLMDYLKGLVERTSAKSGWIEWTFEDGGSLRVEYKPNKRREK